jgi:hypothetical protein
VTPDILVRLASLVSQDLEESLVQRELQDFRDCREIQDTRVPLEIQGQVDSRVHKA